MGCKDSNTTEVILHRPTATLCYIYCYPMLAKKTEIQRLSNKLKGLQLESSRTKV